jgi:hypothetical protein
LAKNCNASFKSYLAKSSVGQAFDPQAVREMTLALQSVCNGLGVSSDDEETTRLVAEKIIELAGHGMRGATLHATAIKELEAHRRKA